MLYIKNFNGIHACIFERTLLASSVIDITQEPDLMLLGFVGV
jgi:hypothetical protein